MADLQKKIAELEASLEASAKDNNDLTAIANDQAKQLEELNAEHIRQDKQVEALLAENETLKAVNDELSKELASLSENSLQAAVDKAKKTEVPTLSAETFEVEETRYGFVSPVMMFEKKRITNADVLASKELQAKLVAAKSGMIKAVS
jgi:predicted nuclease with TOPRIM domain